MTKGWAVVSRLGPRNAPDAPKPLWWDGSTWTTVKRLRVIFPFPLQAMMSCDFKKLAVGGKVNVVHVTRKPKAPCQRNWLSPEHGNPPFGETVALLFSGVAFVGVYQRDGWFIRSRGKYDQPAPGPPDFWCLLPKRPT